MPLPAAGARERHRRSPARVSPRRGRSRRSGVGLAGEFSYADGRRDRYPASGEISVLNEYGKIYAAQLPNGFDQLANGHHRVAALKKLGEETIKIF